MNVLQACIYKSIYHAIFKITCSHCSAVNLLCIKSKTRISILLNSEVRVAGNMNFAKMVLSPQLRLHDIVFLQLHSEEKVLGVNVLMFY